MKNVFVAYVLSLALLFSLISPASVLAQEPVTGANIFEKIPTNDFGTTKKVETVNPEDYYGKTLKDIEG